jgi:hypothetical protein
MRKSNRVLFKPKVYGFNPWSDQVPDIKQIMEEIGQESEAPVLRMLIDEALRARRRKVAGIESPEQPSPAQDLADSLQTIQALLLRMIGQEQTTFRIQSLSLELLQETLTEARAGRVGLWEALAVPALRQQGRSAQDNANRFDAHTEDAKNFAYGLTEEIKDQLVATETDTKSAMVNDEDRQGRLVYDGSDTRENEDSQAA